MAGCPRLLRAKVSRLCEYEGVFYPRHQSSEFLHSSTRCLQDWLFTAKLKWLTTTQGYARQPLSSIHEVGRAVLLCRFYGHFLPLGLLQRSPGSAQCPHRRSYLGGTLWPGDDPGCFSVPFTGLLGLSQKSYSMGWSVALLGSLNASWRRWGLG